MQYFDIGVQVTNEEIADKQLYMYMDLSSNSQSLYLIS